MEAATQSDRLESLTDVCDVEIVSAAGARRDTRPDLLIEVPHGATRGRHFAATRRRLTGDFPDDLERFFYANTDVGSIECARCVARMATRPDDFPELEELLDALLLDAPGGTDRRTIGSVLILRGLVARTFVDLNREIDGGPSSSLRDGLTPGLPAYVNRREDVRALQRMHGDYQGVAARAYDAICGEGGTALILHTYAPRQVDIGEVDEGIVAALRRAYEPAIYETWARRPAVDLISETSQGARLAPEALLRAVRESYARIGIEAAENATYRLHRQTLGHVHSAAYPGRVLCLEISRDLLADPFTPFEEMSIGESKVRRMAAPIAAALLSQLPASSPW